MPETPAEKVAGPAANPVAVEATNPVAVEATSPVAVEATSPVAVEATSPIVARVTRAGRVESIHRGFGAVCDASGRGVAGFGDSETPVFWRSAAKPFQVMPFLEAGGAERFGLTTEEVALAVASHSGEPAHVATAESILEKGGFSAADLRCGATPPSDEASAAAVVRDGRPFSPLHNNCSGKHAAMLLACRLLGFDPATYDDPAHPLQRLILARVAFYAGHPASKIEIGVDGCSLPVFRLPISRLAAAYARLVAPGMLDDESPAAAKARRRAVAAMIAAPFHVSGTGQFTTRFLEAGAGRWIGKEGAEGVYAIGVAAPRLLGIAFKIDDGAARPRFPVAIDILSRLGIWEGGVPESLSGDVRPAILNARGLRVGEVVAAVPVEARADAAKGPPGDPVAGRA